MGKKAKMKTGEILKSFSDNPLIEKLEKGIDSPQNQHNDDEKEFELKDEKSFDLVLEENPSLETQGKMPTIIKIAELNAKDYIQKDNSENIDQMNYQQPNWYIP